MTNAPNTHQRSRRLLQRGLIMGPPLGVMLSFACSGSGTPSVATDNSTCEAGTRLIAGQCVVPPIDGNSAPGSDADNSDADHVADAGPGQADVADGGPSDPCNTIDDASVVFGYYLDCSEECNPTANARCPEVACRASPQGVYTIVYNNDSQFDVSILRTPDRPGTDPTCPVCDGGGFAYAMEFEVTGKARSVVVEPPWFVYGPLDASVPQLYCPPATVTPSGCVSVLDIPATYLVGTTDPNAPARNIYIQPGAYCGH